jgi:hypothetical protein
MILFCRLFLRCVLDSRYGVAVLNVGDTATGWYVRASFFAFGSLKYEYRSSLAMMSNALGSERSTLCSFPCEEFTLATLLDQLATFEARAIEGSIHLPAIENGERLVSAGQQREAREPRGR